MIVDDDSALREAITLAVRRNGYKVLCAGSSGEALDLLAKHKIDVVLADVRMPGGDGISLLGRISETIRPFPVVMLMSGSADIALARPALWARPICFTSRSTRPRSCVLWTT
ncbi:MAG: response regulator [Calothrix sp. SM1_5_4]|nr:response regulator [Calothrix sp. SM1_5_4]